MTMHKKNEEEEGKKKEIVFALACLPLYITTMKTNNTLL